MTATADRVTSMKEEELFSVLVIEPLSVLDEVVATLRVQQAIMILSF
jgi:hypothetical protein